MLEKQRLRLTLLKLKLEVDDEVQAIKEKLSPIARVFSLLGIFKKKGEADQSLTKSVGLSLLKLGASAGVDVLVTRKLARVGWLAKIAVPFVIRGLSAALLNRGKSKAQPLPRQI